MASQKIKSDATIKELETEITALTEQLIQSHQQTTHYDELMKQTAVLQNSMQDLESQNDVLKRTLEMYESRFGELQVDFEKIQFEVRNFSLPTFAPSICQAAVYIEKKR
jgi:Mg2+ and Co2+ transporter CorA